VHPAGLVLPSGFYACELVRKKKKKKKKKKRVAYFFTDGLGWQ
jgi:hypothetical protein